MLARSISYAKDLLAEGYEYSGFEIASVVYDSVFRNTNRKRPGKRPLAEVVYYSAYGI